MAELNRIIRKKNDNFTIVDNTILKDKNVSMKAKALHITVMSLPSDWNFSISGLVSIFKEGERAIRSGIQELIEFGYCNFTKVKGDKGYFIYQYEFLEQQNPLMQNPLMQNADVENADVQNSHIYKELINKEFTDKELKTEIKKPGKVSKSRNYQYTEEFEEVWKLYGRKGDKKASNDEFELAKGRTQNLIEKLRTSIPSYLSSKRVIEGYKRDFERFLKGDLFDSNWEEAKPVESKPIVYGWQYDKDDHQETVSPEELKRRWNQVKREIAA